MDGHMLLESPTWGKGGCGVIQGAKTSSFFGLFGLKWIIVVIVILIILGVLFFSLFGGFGFGFTPGFGF
jgi:hypothetical protein